VPGAKRERGRVDNGYVTVHTPGRVLPAALGVAVLGGSISCLVTLMVLDSGRVIYLTCPDLEAGRSKFRSRPVPNGETPGA
jgi:hypothetical protein